MSQLDVKSLCGIMSVEKPAGVTSREIVDHLDWQCRQLAKKQGQKLKRGAVKIGHAGTLDPLATGVLVVCLGKATRLISYIQNRPKTYRAGFTLGQGSNTDDCTGEIEEVPNAKAPSEAELQLALKSFVGEIEQVPPQFSAVHVNGKRAYALARKGESIELSSRKVHVYEIKLLDYSWPQLELEIVCGSGTYIRSIARDLGAALGCGALMHELERTAIGPFTIETSVKRERLPAEGILPFLRSPREAVDYLPVYTCSEAEEDDLRNGRSISPLDEPSWSDTQSEVSVLDVEGTLVCIAVIKQTDEGLKLQPRHVFNRTET